MHSTSAGQFSGRLYARNWKENKLDAFLIDKYKRREHRCQGNRNARRVCPIAFESGQAFPTSATGCSNALKPKLQVYKQSHMDWFYWSKVMWLFAQRQTVQRQIMEDLMQECHSQPCTGIVTANEHSAFLYWSSPGTLRLHLRAAGEWKPH